jgi:TolB-like protein/tetratricopeptide (TPR) repeat protein
VNEANDIAVSEQAIREELDRLLQSPIFAQSDRLGRFLRFTVEHAISGTQDALKEYLIGAEVYDRKPPYHPSQDSIVRTEARRLRSKLKEYYEGEGKGDPIFIYFRPGSYVPVFRSRGNLDSHSSSVNAENGLFIQGNGSPIAVIPFVDMSASPLSAACAHGITDELIHLLMRTDGCRVIAASSMMQLGSLANDIPTLADKLGVQFVFEGTVREEGNRVRVTARLVNADGFQLWSQRFEAESDANSLFRIEEQIASALVSRVGPRQSVVRKLQASAGPSLLKLYPAILAAEELLEEGNAADLHAALARFQAVAQSAPEYARAHCGVAQCYIGLAQRGAPDSSQLVAQARKASLRTLELDPEMIEAHSAMACALAMEWNWKEAEVNFRRALALGSHHGTYRQFAAFLAALGRFDEAWTHLQIAQQIDPFSYRQKASYARFFFWSRRYKEATEHFSKPLMYGPLPPEVLVYQALVQVQLGHGEEAKKIAQTMQRSAGGQSQFQRAIAEIYALCGDKALAAGIVDECGLLDPAHPTSRFRKASLALALGDPNKAVSLLHESWEEREAELPWLAVDARFDPIRDRPRVGKIVKSVRSGVVFSRQPQPEPQN